MKSSCKSKWCLRHTFEFIMSSFPSSVTQQSASSMSMVVSKMENHHHMFTSYRDLLGQDTHHELWQLETKGICYAADEAITFQYKFTFNKDFKGDILVPKNAEESISEFILLVFSRLMLRIFLWLQMGNGILITQLVPILNKSNHLVTFFLFNMILLSLWMISLQL